MSDIQRRYHHRIQAGPLGPASSIVFIDRAQHVKGRCGTPLPLRVLACLRQPLTCLAGDWLGLPKVERERLSFVRDPCASERKRGVLSGHDRIDRSMI
jgi:hypothetical protein